MACRSRGARVAQCAHAARARSGPGRGPAAAGVARQVQVPQPREPEAQRRGAQQRRQQAPLVAVSGRTRVVGGDEGLRALLGEAAVVQVDAPVVQAHRDVEQRSCRRRRNRSRRSRSALVAASPASNITLSRNRSAWIGAARQRRRARATRPSCCWKASSLSSSARCAGVEVRPHHRHRLDPPGQAAQVGLLGARSPGPAMCMRASIAPTCAQWSASGASWWPPPSLSTKRGRLALERVQQRAAGVGLRLGHRDAAPRQVAHQLQVEGQLLCSSGARRSSAPNAALRRPARCRRRSCCSRCRPGCRETPVSVPTASRDTNCACLALRDLGEYGHRQPRIRT